MILYGAIVGRNYRTVVEIGVREGISTQALLIGCKETSGHVNSVDVDSCDRAKETIRKLGLDSLWTFTQDDSLSFIKRWRAPIDLLFIDGSHEFNQTLGELRAYDPWVSLRGAIFLHDSLAWATWRGVFQAITSFLVEKKCYIAKEHATRYGLCELTKYRRLSS